MRNGLYFGASYTVSKMLEATSFRNANDAGPERVISNSDRPQRLVLHGLYELPFGPGRAFAAANNPWLRRLVSDWQVNWVITVQSGPPLEFMGMQERTADTNNDPKTVDRYFDIAQFVPLAPFTLRTSSLRTSDIRAPGINKWDITIQKSVEIREQMNIRFQAELYNAFNRTHFGAPNTTVTSTSFGRITDTFLGPREVQLSARFSF
jgi:hypothetical protein